MIMLLYGPDTYRSKQRLHQLKEGFKKKYDPSGSNIAVLNGEKLKLEDFRKAAGAVGFLSSKRLVVVEEVIAKNKKKDIQKELVEYFTGGWSDDNVVIFWEADLNSKAPKKSARGGKKKTDKAKAARRTARPLLDHLLSQKQVEEFPLLKGEQLKKWIRAEVHRLSGSVDPQAVDELAVRVGSNLWQMSSEIEKLVGYQGKKSIRMEDVQNLVVSQYDDNIFHLTDAIAEKNIQSTFALLNDQLDSGAHQLYILTMLVRQFRLLVQARDILETEPHPSTLASRLRIHPFVATRLAVQAKKFTSDELERIYQELVELDVKFKTSEAEPKLLFDLFAVSVCASRSA